MSQYRPPSKPNAPTRTVLLNKSYYKNNYNKTKVEKDDLFLKGPIPLSWLIRASSEGGKALLVGIYIWFISGVRKSGQVEINLKLASRLTGASRRTTPETSRRSSRRTVRTRRIR